MLWNAWAGLQSLAIYPNDNFLSFLPLSHTLERSIGYYLPIMAGATITYARSIPQLAEDLLEQRPTVLISVPRIYERVYNRVQDQLKEKSSIAQKLFNTAVDIGWLHFEYEQKRAKWQAALLLYPLLNHLIGKKIQDRLGGQLRIAICGGAPLSEKVAKTFIALGIPIFQGYGLTETSPVVSVNTLERNLPKSIGLPLKDVMVRFDEQGALQVKSPGVMLGYWNNDAATKETIDEEGWLHTGDIGKQDDEGFIHITGRLKDIIVLSNGEKISPADMEMAINADPYIEHAIVIGEGRPFLTAIVVLAEQAWSNIAQQAGLSTTDPGVLKSNPEVVDRVLQRIDNCLKGFPSYAEVIAVTLTLEPWTVENELSTPTLKAKRPRIIKRYQDEIDKMYQGH
jgi:long-chain acyl-CoA synthetase